MTKKRIVGKAKKKCRRNRQEYARVNNLYFEERHPKSEGLSPPDDAGIIAMATMMTMLARRRTGRSSGNNAKT